MVVNPLFTNYENINEQQILEGLVVESIQIYGQNVWYLPRVLQKKDPLYEQSDIVFYNSAYLVEMYIKDYYGQGFGIDTNFLSKFGLEIRNQVIFIIARRTFAEQVAYEEPDIILDRPREGDLIYFPLNGRAFQIKYVNKYEMLYPLGALYSWELTCELFEYSGELFNTGIDEIDQIQLSTTDLIFWALHIENGNYLMTEANNYLVTEKYQASVINPLDNSNTMVTTANNFIDPIFNNPNQEVLP